LTINKANATVTGNSATVTYNGAIQTVSGFTATGLVGGETTSVLTGVTASVSGKNWLMLVSTRKPIIFKLAASSDCGPRREC
jgi:hypothetical protein